MKKTPSSFQPTGFTLIELLVVMAIIGALAAMLLAVVGGVKKKQYVYNTQAEMAKIETAIERYKAVYGVYPPSSPAPPTSVLVNPLYYELVGTVYNPTNNPPTYTTLDGTPPALTGGPSGNVLSAFGVGGFVNCTKPGTGEDAATARSFISDLKPNQIYNFSNSTTGLLGVNLLVASVGGPDQTYKPLGLPDLNPWGYNSSNPTNNPGSYDLWIRLVIGGKSNLICNWSKTVQIQ